MANLDHKKVGQALQEVPIGDMLYGLCHNVVETQRQLDKNSVDQLIRMAEQKVELPDGEDGTQTVSLLSLGLVPSFYHFSEASFRIALDLKHEVGGEKKIGLEVGLNANYANGREERIREYKSQHSEYEKAVATEQGRYFSRYTYLESETQGNRGSFINKRVEVVSTSVEDQDKKRDHTISAVYLTKAQVDTFNYAHAGQLWRPRVIIANADGNPKHYLCVLNLNADGKIDTSSLAYETRNGQQVYRVMLRTQTNDLPQTRWPVIKSADQALVAYVEDPEDATQAIKVDYLVNVMSYTKDPKGKGKTYVTPVTAQHWGILCFSDGSNFDAIDGVLSNLPSSEPIDTGANAYVTESGVQRNNAAPGEQTAIPDSTGGMLDVGRGYHQTNADNIDLDCPLPTNEKQADEYANARNSGRHPTMLHKPGVKTMADQYGQLKFHVKSKRRNDGSLKADHGCFYQQQDVTAAGNKFFDKVPEPMSVTPKKPQWVLRNEKLIAERAAAGFDEKSTSSSASGGQSSDSSREVDDAKNRISVGVSATLSLESTRKYNYEMSAASSIDAKLVAVPAPSKLVDKLIENL